MARWFREYSDKEQLPESARFALDLAIEELFTNMVKYNPDGDPTIGIELSRNGSLIKVQLQDGGQPFDLTKAREVDVTLPISARRPGGLGIHLVRSMMDEVSYRYRDGMNEITLLKKMNTENVPRNS